MVEIDGEEYYSAEEACGVLGVKLATLYSYVNRGLLVSYRQNIRRRRLYRREEVERLLDVSPVDRDAARDVIPLAETWAADH